MVPPQRCAKKANAKLATSKLVNTKTAKTILANATVANSYWGRAGVILLYFLFFNFGVVCNRFINFDVGIGFSCVGSERCSERSERSERSEQRLHKDLQRGSETVFGTDVRNRQCSEQCSELTHLIRLLQETI